jgi:hypothetical protein
MPSMIVTASTVLDFNFLREKRGSCVFVFSRNYRLSDNLLVATPTLDEPGDCEGHAKPGNHSDNEAQQESPWSRCRCPL